MGIDFRGKGYVRRVRVGKRTVKEGEAVAVWDAHGRHSQILGPQRLRMWWSTIRFLDRFVAGKDEYLRVEHADGTIEHIKGPTTLFENPVLHRRLAVEQAIRLQSASQHVVVHREEAEGEQAAVPASGASGGSSQPPATPKGEAARASELVISGPALFFPRTSDAVHVFRWRSLAPKKGPGAAVNDDADGSMASLLTHALTQKGRVLDTEAKIALTVACDVRGADGHAARVGVVLQVQFLTVREVLAVADPISECRACVQNGLADAASGLPFNDRAQPLPSALRGVVSGEAFQERLRETLAQQAACKLLGVSLQNVEPSKELESLLRQEDELVAQRVAEQKADAALEAAAAREEKEHALNAAKQRHALALEAERRAATAKQVEEDAKRAMYFLKDLKGAGADVTTYLQAQAMRPDGGPPGLFEAGKGAKAAGNGWW